MSHHQRIDQWSLAMAREIVSRIESDPSRAGLDLAIETARRWHRQSPNASTAEWLRILERPWEQIRACFLDESDEGQRLRSSAPFCGILSPRERLELFKQFRAS